MEREYGQGKVPAAGPNNGHANGSAVDVKGVQKASRQKEGPAGTLRRILSPIFMEVCVVTFLAEWGDRSQIATIGELPLPLLPHFHQQLVIIRTQDIIHPLSSGKGNRL